MRRAIWFATLGFALAATAAVPSRAAAQEEEALDVLRWIFGIPNFTVEVYGGLANYGRFLEQYAAVTPLLVGQRELRADNAFSFGGSFGMTLLPRTGLRLSYTRAKAELDYERDSGILVLDPTDGIDELVDIDDIGELASNTLALEFIRYLLPERLKYNAYGTLGLAGVWWNLDEDRRRGLIIAGGGGETIFRFAGVAGVGLQFRPSRRWAIRGEAVTFAINNPFDDEGSYLVTSGLTFDEPDRVRQTNFRATVSYTFGRPERPELPRRRRR